MIPGLQTFPTDWRKPPLIRSPWARWSLGLGCGVYLLLTLSTVEVNLARVQEGMIRGAAFVAAFFQPDFVTRWDDISAGILESLAMTGAATALGVLISIPIGLGAARNISLLPVYLVCRSIISITRAMQDVIVAIFFVALFGFGPLAGVLTLIFTTIGFIGKLLAEEIEAMEQDQLEAIRATGATWLQVINFAVQPRVAPRIVGLSIYRLDINFRESAVIGIVGAGGIGATLNTAFDRYEFGSAAAILLLIIFIVMVTEYASGIIRKRLE